MTTDDQPQSPLTMEFNPGPAYEGDPSEPVVAVEPSFQMDGRIFVAVHPYGRRVGLHLLPADAERIRNHLSKLLMDRPENTTDAPEGVETPVTPPVDWRERIAQAAQRAQPRKPRKRLLGHFRLEWQIGRFVLVLGTSQDD